MVFVFLKPLFVHFSILIASNDREKRLKAIITNWVKWSWNYFKSLIYKYQTISISSHVLFMKLNE